MSLSVWQPLRQLEDFDRVLDSFFVPQRARATGARDSQWRPAADYVAEPERYRLWVDLPGVGKQDVDISLEQGVLTVRGERKHPASAAAESDAARSDRRVYLTQIPTGAFARAFHLPEDADGSDVAASFTDGVLEIRVAKKKTAQPRKIEIGNA